MSVLNANFNKNGGLAIFLTAKPNVFLRNSGLGLKLLKHGNWGELGPV